jgi:hypothetical protein
MSELWASDWILHHDCAQTRKALYVKQFLAQKSIIERATPPPRHCPDFTPTDFWLFPKLSLKVRRFKDIKDMH